MLQNPYVLLTIDKVHNPLRLLREATSERPKVLRTPHFFCIFDFEMCFAPQRRALFRHLNFQKWSELVILTWKGTSRHNGVHFFDIVTSKKGPTLRYFVYFDFEICFAPQRRALFQHLNFQKCSDNGVFCGFWFRNVLRTTTACAFSTS